MSAVFFFLFGAHGTLMPYLGPYYRSLGLTGVQVSLLVAVMPAMLVLSQPVFGPLTDRSGHRGRMLARLLLVSGLMATLMALPRTFLPLIAATVLWAFFYGALIPIADSVALGEVQRTGVSYPRLRLWGSLGFLLASSAVGPLYAGTDLRWAFGVFAALCAVTFAAARRLPAEGATGKGPIWRDLKRLALNPRVMALLGVASVLQLAQAAHYAFFSIHFLSVGGSSKTIGLAWSMAALLEIPVWLILGRVMDRFSALPLLTAAGVVYSIRWLLYGAVASPGALIGLQALHSVSFGIFMPTSVVLMGQLAPQELRTSGQALLSLTVHGVVTVTGTLGAGWLVDRIGTAGLFTVMGYVALAGAVGALALWITSRRGKAGADRG